MLYELQLTTTLRSAAELRAVEVIDASNGNTLLKLGPEDITRGEYLDTLDRKATETNSFEGRVLLNLSFDERPDLPPKVVHRFHISRNDPFTAQPAAFDFAPARLSSPRASLRFYRRCSKARSGLPQMAAAGRPGHTDL